ncbi:AraC family transcriptional regulator [Sinomicrobium pectinilyticum]|uniref:AraC family transcriptional regulator n=1 Tax=Sinomicrobium pectinilyticum TaxID=1084421 RepID=A0A3N0ELI2_SINP1|nr:AraC family transcriptional regulator [Sinomicrobium pectinilyticum]RNL88674.1 AraC family transcriptional regulator [Sinomicrobium pectinilyticum]
MNDLEHISIRNQAAAFPEHYHDTFCISLIRNGTETIAMDGKKFYGEAGSITITNPYEVHANPLADAGIKLDFDTIYISGDLMKYLFGGKNVVFRERNIRDVGVVRNFLALRDSLSVTDAGRREALLPGFATSLRPFAEGKEADYSELSPADLREVMEYIRGNITGNLSLEALARVANCNKYGFAKKFRVSTGMSPMHYVLMKKIFAGKRDITPHTELTRIAYDYGFTDLPHFSRTFKRFVGIAPSTYQKSLLQGE